MERTKRQKGEHEELRSVSSADALVVFVHGLGGDYKKTWGQLPDFLCDDRRFANTDVYLFGYKTGLARFFVPPLDALGQRLRTVLLTELTASYSSITIIAHSMGGLVIKEAVASVVQSGTAQKLRFVGHVVFCSTPHLGSVKASFFPFLGKHARELRALKPKILDTHKLWLGRVNAAEPGPDDIIHERYTWKTRITNVWGLYDNVVSLANATALPSLEETVTITGTHTSMVKPPTREHNIYETLSGLLVFTPATSSKLASDRIFQASEGLGSGDLIIRSTSEIPDRYEALCCRYSKSGNSLGTLRD